MTSPVTSPTGRARTGPPTQRAPEQPPARSKSRAAPSGGVAWLLRLVSGLGLTLVATVALAGFGGLLVWVKLLYDPLSLRFLVDPIRQALMSELDGLDVTIGDAALHRAPTGEIELRLKDLRLATADRSPLVDAAEAVVDLDFAAMTSGRIAASRIVLVGTRLVVQPSGVPVADPNAIEAVSPARGGERGVTIGPAAASGAVAPTGSSPAQPIRIDLARLVSDGVARLRRGGDSAAHLRSFGLRNATLVVAGQRGDVVWSVPELAIDLDHRQKRSFVSGRGRLAAGGEPFSVEFRLEDSEKARAMRLTTEVRGVQLASLARHVPGIEVLAGLDVPVSARGVAELATSGDLGEARIDLEVGKGQLSLAGAAGKSVGGISVDGGQLTLLCRQGGSRYELAPSLLRVAGGWLRLTGSLQPETSDGRPGGDWLLALESQDGALGQPSAPISLEALDARIRIPTAGGAATLDGLTLRAGGAEIKARGTFGAGPREPPSIAGQIGPMSLETVYGLWPPGLAPGAREALTRALPTGRIKGGSFRLAAAAEGADPGQARTMLTLESEALSILLGGTAPPLVVPRALLAVDGANMEVTIPEANLQASANRRLSLRAVQLSVAGFDQPRPIAEITGRIQGTVATVVDLAQREPFSLVRPGQVPAGTDGKIDGQFRVQLPLGEGVSAADVRPDVKLRVTEGRIPDMVGTHDVTGANFNIALAERVVDLKGEMLVAGILAKASGQWAFGEPAERQSPIVITARLDTADRRQLGLGLDEIVTGDIPIEIHITPGDSERSRVHVTGDLAGAELVLDGLAWRKPAGRAARLSFDVVRRQPRGLELQAFRLTGDGIAIDGSVVLGPDGSAQSYRFPGFSLNVVSNLEVEATRGSDRAWEITARGKTFDGGDLMRSLYTVDQGATRPAARRGEGVVDLDAQIDTVLGTNEVSVRQVRLRMRKQGERMVSLHVTGVLDGNHPLDVRLKAEPGQPRVVHATSNDAGQALRMLGVYTSMAGGKGDLWVNLDGRGAAEREGQIRVSKFRILGDPVVSELIQGADESRPAIATGTDRGQRRVVREEIQFDNVIGRFSSGNGQLALESLNAAGPLIGASVRGKLDFRRQSVSVGGTYVPLSGLNRALAGIPLFGEILTGPRGDGIFGITFAVEGPMSRPNVIVNPLSIVAPGVLREIFQMVPDNPRVTPAAEPKQAAPGAGTRVRSSGPETGKAAPSGSPPPSKVLDGWSSETRQTPPRSQR